MKRIRWVEAALFVAFLGSCFLAGRAFSSEPVGIVAAARAKSSATSISAPERPDHSREYEAARRSNPFSPARAPMDRTTTAASPAHKAADPAPPLQHVEFRLVGTTIMPGGRNMAAIIAGAGQPRTVRPGDELDGWKVDVIDRGRVRLTRGTDTRELQLGKSQ